MKKKALILIYEGFSLYEINCLTAYLTINQPENENWILDKVSFDMNPVESEDQFKVLPDLTFDEVIISNYSVIILPGIIDFRIPLDNQNIIDFLRSLKNKSNRPLISSISSSPILLAKAGLLENVKYTGGLFEEVIDKYDFLERANLTRTPIHYDKEANIITAIGFAFREFAIETAKHLNMEVSDNFFKGIDPTKEYTAKDFTYYINPPERDE